MASHPSGYSPLVDDTRSVSPGLRIFLWSRAAIWVVAVISVVFFERASDPGAEWDTPRLHELGTVIDVWARWDSNWFLKIAEEGYSWPSSTPAFFPLYPFLVAGLGVVLLGHYLLAGVVLSLVAGSAAFVLLYRLTALKLGAEAAQRTVLFLALAPTSLFFGAVYSESLFLLLAVATFLTAEKGSFWKAGGLAGLAILTRSAGIALLPALIVFAWRAPNRRRALAGVAVAPALFALFPLLLALWIEKPLAFLDAQKVVWERHLSPVGPIGGLIAAVRDHQILDLAVVGVMVVLGGRRLATDRCPLRPLRPRQRGSTARRVLGQGPASFPATFRHRRLPRVHGARDGRSKPESDGHRCSDSCRRPRRLCGQMGIVVLGRLTRGCW